MKPGRELDALIAEKVMGWERLPSGEVWNGPSDYILKPYSTDISAAWKVVEKLRDDNFTLQENGTHWKASFGPEWRGAETAPHAICLAALKAMGVEV